MKSNPLVSICIPTYMGERFIEKTLLSALRQTYQNLEIIVIDDNSPDRTRNIVERFNDNRLKYIINTTNLGAEGNWNECLKLATGKYYKLLPHDDILAPECISDQIAPFETDEGKNIALVFGKRTIIDSHDNAILTRGLPYSASTLLKASELVNLCVRSGTNRIGEPGNGLIRTEIIRKIGLYDASCPYMIDLDFWFRALQFGDAHYSGKLASSFRLNPDSWSVRIGKNQLSDFIRFIRKIKKAPGYEVRMIDVFFGILAAAVNTASRLIIYKFLAYKNK